MGKNSPHPNPLLKEREFAIAPLLLQEKGPGDEVKMFDVLRQGDEVDSFSTKVGRGMK